MEINAFLNHNDKDTPNIVLVKKLYEALNNGERYAITEILSENPTWNVCPGIPHGGVYYGINEVFGTFYRALIEIYGTFRADCEAFIDGGDVVVVLGFYVFKARKEKENVRIRFSHTWKVSTDNRIEGVWQVCDSYEMRKYLETE